MRRKYSEIKGMEVLAHTEGQRLGSVRRLHIDSKRKVVLGMVFRPSHVSAEGWVPVERVERLGVDVVFLPTLEGTRSDPAPGRDAGNMLGLPVTSLDGKRLGNLHDLVIDTAAWSIAALVLEGGNEVDVSAETVFGEDTVLLQKGAIHQVRPGAGPPARSGFLKRVFGPEEKREGKPEGVLTPEDFGLKQKKPKDPEP